MNNVCLAGTTGTLSLYERDINAAALQASVPACLLAAIVMRESRGRNILQVGMPAGPGCGVGLCQITYGVDWSDIKNPTLNGYALLIPRNNLLVAATYYLAPAISECSQFEQTKPLLFNVCSRGQIAYGAAAVYNGGWGAMQSAIGNGNDVSNYVTGGDDGPYCVDVYAKYLNFCKASHAALGH
jgi:hypothetical protein